MLAEYFHMISFDPHNLCRRYYFSSFIEMKLRLSDIMQMIPLENAGAEFEPRFALYRWTWHQRPCLVSRPGSHLLHRLNKAVGLSLLLYKIKVRSQHQRAFL